MKSLNHNSPNEQHTDSNVETPTPTTDIEFIPILGLLRKLETLEIADKVRSKGLSYDDAMSLATLQATVNHAERIIRLRRRAGIPFDDIQLAADIVREEIRKIDARLAGCITP